MLQKLREKTSGWIAGAILVLLIVPFAFFGVENYFTQPAATYVAKVNDTEIEQQQYSKRFDEFRSQMRQMMGDRFDPAQFESAETKRQVLDRLIDEELLRQAAENSGVIVPAERIRQEIAQIPAFQAEGKFSPEQYRAILAAQNMSPRSFQDRLQRDLMLQAIPSELVSSGFVTDAYLSRYLALRDQTRSFDYLLLPPPGADQVGEIDEAQLQAHYEKNADRYVEPETVVLEYLELDASTLEVPVSADESTLRQRYEEQKTRYVEPEQRLASHVLISVDANADAEAQKAAQAKAQSIAEQARAPGADFAALAKAHSEDPGSKNTGGDLGWIEKGITDPAFEAALYAMQPGTISDPVKGADGWHVIQLREVKAEAGKPFEEVRAEIEREYLDGERERKHSEIAGKLIDVIYRDPSTLAAASTELGLPIQRTERFSREGGPGIAANPEVLRAAFSDPVLVDRAVSDPIDLGPSHSVVVRVAEHTPAKPRKFEVVRDQVRESLVAELAAEKSREEAKAALEKLRAGGTLAALAAERKLELRSADKVGRAGATVDPTISEQAFEMPHPAEGKPSFDTVELPTGGHALIALKQVVDGDPSKVDAAARASLAEQLAQAMAGAEANDYVKALRSAAKIDVVEDRL
jgi:peptidyl-prolyl cis-trans isomerase D